MRSSSRNRLLVNLTLAASVSIWQSASSLSAQAPTAKTLISQAIRAQGGEEKLRAIKSVHWEAIGYRNELEQSERPEGPYIVEFDAISETHDYAGKRYRRTVEASVYPSPSFTSGLVVADGVGMALSGKASGPSGPDQLKIAAERQALSPEILLLTASDAKDLELEPDVVLQAIPQRVLKFTLDGAPARVYLNPYTKLQSVVDRKGRHSLSATVER
jgi:hypothetical protein